jgi:hypothetical protein
MFRKIRFDQASFHWTCPVHHSLDTIYLVVYVNVCWFERNQSVTNIQIFFWVLPIEMYLDIQMLYHNLRHTLGKTWSPHWGEIQRCFNFPSVSAQISSNYNWFSYRENVQTFRGYVWYHHLRHKMPHFFESLCQHVSLIIYNIYPVEVHFISVFYLQCIGHGVCIYNT